MSEMSVQDLPDAYIGEGNRRIVVPTYEALMPCQIVMVGETGVAGPTRIEAGEHFSTEATPCHQWLPLNRAAGERYAAWIESLPLQGQGLTQEELTEAAFAMRPREGEKELPHEQWWPAVLRYAAAMKEKRRGLHAPMPQPGYAHRPGTPLTVMPFASAGPVMPTEVGRAPIAGGPANAAAARNAASRTRPGAPRAPTLPGTVASESPANATG